MKRAFLCGDDRYTGENFAHRRQWMIDRIRALTDIFGIEVFAYVIISNHYHLVLYVNELALKDCSDADICERWGKIDSIPPITTIISEINGF